MLRVNKHIACFKNIIIVLALIILYGANAQIKTSVDSINKIGEELIISFKVETDSLVAFPETKSFELLR